MVPDGWSSTDLRSLSALITKGATPTTYGHKFVGESISSVRFVGAYNCSFDGKFRSGSEKWISENSDSMLKRSQLNDGDSIICIVGNTIGSSFLVSNAILPANINQNVALVRPDRKKLDPRYLHLWIISSYIQWQVQQEASTQAQPSLSLKQVGDFKIVHPPLPEQAKIAQILSTWDQAITATERLLENSQQRKKGLMQQLLTGRKRLPGFDGEWESKSISQTGKIISGGTPDTNDSDLWGGDVQWLTPTDITALKTHFIYDTPRKITEKGVKESSAALMPSGSLCVCTRASVGLMAISTTPITTNQGFKSVIPNNKHDVEFLYYLFSFNRHVFIRYSSGSTFMELSKKDFVKIIFSYPPVAEQKAIARILASANDEIEQLQKRIDGLKQEKKALMQQLLTGKRRVQVEMEVA